MKICIVGAGYVGLCQGVVFAEAGNEVICVDVNEERIAKLNLGEPVLYELGLSDLLRRGLKSRRLRFTSLLESALKDAQIIFCCVGTPSLPSGRLDTSAIFEVAKSVQALREGGIFVVKSTVPVGTCRNLARRLEDIAGEKRLSVVFNPEFLKEGTAIADALRPDRIVLGGERAGDRAMEYLRDLYEPFVRGGAPILPMLWESAELVKLGANAYLSTRVSFVNELAVLCEKITGADIDEVRRGIGADRRIGNHFFYPGIGWGGSCFGKDVGDLQQLMTDHALPDGIVAAARQVNVTMRNQFANKVLGYFGRLTGKHIAVWGLAFKAGTDDVRDSPAVAIVRMLQTNGALVAAHDPEARPVEGILQFPDPYQAAEGADALCVLTEWPEYRRPDWTRLYKAMQERVVFDGRNLYEPSAVRRAGFDYVGVGRR